VTSSPSAGQGLDHHARRLVGGDEGSVLGRDAQEVPEVVRVPVGGPGRTRAVHPDPDTQARRQPVRRLAGARALAVEEHLAAFSHAAARLRDPAPA